jgi:pentose-5-phosphate-3-epimerase
MSIAQLGKQGAAFEPRIIPRIEELRAMYPSTTIAIDGGVSEKNIAELVRAGATRFGVGSAISKASDPKVAYENLKTLAENALQ